MTTTDIDQIQEKRSFPRIVNPSLVYVSSFSQEEAETTTAILHDISEGGLSFIAEGSYHVSDLLSLEVRLASSVHFFKGMILRTESMSGMTLVGIRFIDMPSDHRQALQDALLFQ